MRQAPIKDWRFLLITGCVTILVVYNIFLLVGQVEQATYNKIGAPRISANDDSKLYFKKHQLQKAGSLNLRELDSEGGRYELNPNPKINSVIIKKETMKLNQEKITAFVDKERKNLIQLHETLIEAWRHSRGDKSGNYIKKAISMTEEMLGGVDEANVMPFKDKIMTSKFVCPEVFKGSTYGYPFFNNGFEMSDCKIRRNIRTYLTILIDSSTLTLLDMRNIVQNIRKNYSFVPILIGCNTQTHKAFTAGLKDKHIKFIPQENSVSTGKIWDTLFRSSKTEFVLVARDVKLFEAMDARLERLVRVIDQLGVKIAAGARRNVKDGVWSIGCFQSTLKNYTLTYQEGYDRSALECVYCDYTNGPFVTRRSLYEEIEFQPMHGDAFFRDMFIKLQNSNNLAVTCPDSMFYTTDFSKETKRKKNFWLRLVQEHKLNVIEFNSNDIVTFDCDESKTDCGKITGVALPPCCLKHLSYAVVNFMKICEKANIICELQAGTLLGAVKFNKILPWERDADLTFLTANFTALEVHLKALNTLGMSANLERDALWCCVDGIQAGGKGMAYYQEWHLELYGQHHMDSEFLRERGLTPTKIPFDGYLINVPRNPGLHVRNMYGHFCYGHAQHWMALSKTNSWEQYHPKKFTTCNILPKINCLDQYFADGNIQFTKSIP